jgi:uncharacterized membrane protein
VITTPGIRKVTLTVHVMSSVGWLGVVATFLALSVIGLTSRDAQTVRRVYLVMEAAARLVLLPFALASLLTGVVSSLVSPWGVFRHYWVVAKLVLTALATLVLLIYMGTFRLMADLAADPGVDLAGMRNASPALHAVLALLVLLSTTGLAVYKPRGMTSYGWRKQHEGRAAPPR